MKTMYLSPSVNSYQQVVSWLHLGLSCFPPHPTGSLEVNGTGRVVFPQRPQTGVERTLYQTECVEGGGCCQCLGKAGFDPHHLYLKPPPHSHDVEEISYSRKMAFSRLKGGGTVHRNVNLKRNSKPNVPLSLPCQLELQTFWAVRVGWRGIPGGSGRELGEAHGALGPLEVPAAPPFWTLDRSLATS